MSRGYRFNTNREFNWAPQNLEAKPSIMQVCRHVVQRSYGFQINVVYNHNCRHIDDLSGIRVSGG